MRLNFFKKQLFTTFLIIIFSLTVLMMILSFALNSYIADSKHETLTKSCEEITEYIKDYKQDSSQKENGLYDLVKTVSTVSEATIFISDSKGFVLLCGCEDWQEDRSCIHSKDNISQEYIFKTEEKSLKDEVFLSDLGIYKKPHYVTAKSVISDNGSIYCTVFVTTPIAVVSNLLSTVIRLYIISAIIPTIIMFIALYVMSYKTIKPLKLMSEASKAMSRGDFSKRIPVMSDDEIGELSASFNMLTNSLAKSEGMRKSFVANVSHELKTPMTTIGGFIDGILDGTIEPEKQRYYLNIVSDEVKRLSRLVQSMLSMSRLESGEFVLNPRLFDLRELIFNIVLSQEQRIESNKINIIGLDELPEVSINADKDLIHQVLYNLLDNAIKFTNEGGSITFSLKNESNKTVFILSNTGEGIPKKDIPYIFERFYKVDKSRSTSKNSTGLGLFIVKTIVNAHNGTIAVSSKENEATYFKVELPNRQLF